MRLAKTYRRTACLLLARSASLCAGVTTGETAFGGDAQLSRHRAPRAAAVRRFSCAHLWVTSQGQTRTIPSGPGCSSARA